MANSTHNKKDQPSGVISYNLFTVLLFYFNYCMYINFVKLLVKYCAAKKNPYKIETSIYVYTSFNNMTIVNVY